MPPAVWIAAGDSAPNCGGTPCGGSMPGKVAGPPCAACSAALTPGAPGPNGVIPPPIGTDIGVAPRACIAAANGALGAPCPILFSAACQPGPMPPAAGPKLDPGVPPCIPCNAWFKAVAVGTGGIAVIPVIPVGVHCGAAPCAACSA